MLIDYLPTVPVLKHQAALLESTAPNVGMPAGLGSGKTRGLVLKACQLAEINHGLPGFIVEPTRGHVRNVLVPELTEFAAEIGASFVWRKSESKGVMHLGDGVALEFVFFSGDRPETVVGINAAWGLVDEAGWQKDSLLKAARARVRHPRARLRQYVEAGTPEGFNGFWEFCEGRPPEGFELIRARTVDNVFIDVDEYIRTRFSHFSDEELALYMEGLFVARHGRVYTYYDPKIHEAPCPDPFDGQLVIAADFGTRTCAWAFGRIKPTPHGEEFHIWGELVGRGTDTWQQLSNAKEILERAAYDHTGEALSWRALSSRIKVYCDASGQYQGHGEGTTHTDVEILVAAGLNVEYPRRNPAVLDRVYSVQDRLRRGLLYVDPEAAPYVARCLYQQGYARNGMPEKSKDHDTGTPGLDHGADAVGYVCAARWPVAAPRGNETQYRF